MDDTRTDLVFSVSLIAGSTLTGLVLHLLGALG